MEEQTEQQINTNQLAIYSNFARAVSQPELVCRAWSRVRLTWSTIPKTVEDQ